MSQQSRKSLQGAPTVAERRRLALTRKVCRLLDRPTPSGVAEIKCCLGEVIAADETGRPQFDDLLRGTRAPTYVALDLLWLDGTDLRSLPLSDRRRGLQGILPKASPVISEAVSVVGRGRELYELMRAHDLEGIVAKRLADPYEPRTRWLKIKNPDYAQQEGRGDLFNRPSQRRAASA